MTSGRGCGRRDPPRAASDFGGPDQLELVEVDTPEPGEGEVRLAVRAIGVNPIDWYHYDGVHSDDPEDLHTFGYEVSGVIEAIGRA